MKNYKPSRKTAKRRLRVARQNRRRRRRWIPFPAYSYAFIQRGVNYTRSFSTWALLQKAGLEVWKRPLVVKVICRRMGLSPRQARAILTHGDGKFWTLASGMLYPQTPRQVAHLIRNLHLTRYVKRSKFYVPEAALRNLSQLRAHLAFPVMSATPDDPTPRAYTAKCLGRCRNTISVYRRWLLAGEEPFITVERQYRRLRVAGMSEEELDWFESKRNCFVIPGGEWGMVRFPDLVRLTEAAVFRVYKSLRSYAVNEQVEFAGLKYRFSSFPTPTTAPPTPRPPPSTQAFVQMLRQEVRVRRPAWPTFSPRQQPRPNDFVPTTLKLEKEKAEVLP